MAAVLGGRCCCPAKVAQQWSGRPPPTGTYSLRPLRATRPLVTVRNAVRGIIFDMDGVLTASEHISREAAASTLARLYGVRAAPDAFIPHGGMGEERFLRGVAQEHGVADFDATAAIAAFLEEYFVALAQPGVKIAYQGAVELVRACRAAGLKTAVGSSAAQSKVDANLAAAGFEPSDFDAIISGSAVTNSKPAPDIFLAAAQAMKLLPAECVVVEDAPAGIAAARAAGMRVVGVTTMLPASQMTAHSPDLVCSDIGSLKAAELAGLAG